MDTAGLAGMNLPINYYYENQHMAKELRGDQDEHSLINWLMTLNYKKRSCKCHGSQRVLEKQSCGCLSASNPIIIIIIIIIMMMMMLMMMKIDEKCFLFHLKSSFSSQDIYVLSQRLGHAGKTARLER